MHLQNMYDTFPSSYVNGINYREILTENGPVLCSGLSVFSNLCLYSGATCLLYFLLGSHEPDLGTTLDPNLDLDPSIVVELLGPNQAEIDLA